MTKVQTYLLRTTTTKILEMKMLYVFGTHSFYEILLRNFEVSIFLMPWKKTYATGSPLLYYLRSSSWFLLRGRGTILMVAARRTGFFFCVAKLQIWENLNCLTYTMKPLDFEEQIFPSKWIIDPFVATINISTKNSSNWNYFCESIISSNWRHT